MHLSAHSPSLLLGLQSGQILVLSLPSLQLLRTILPSSPPMPPVTFLSTLLRPPDLIARANLGAANRGGAGGKEEELPLRPFGTLGRTIEPAQTREKERVVYVRLPDTKDVRVLLPSHFGCCH